MGLGLGTRHQVVFLPAAEAPPKPRRRWALYAALGAQLLLLSFLPGHKVAAARSGQPITLAVVPVDPVDPLRGRYVDLRYVAGDGDRLAKLPGYDAGRAADGTAVWLTMEAGIGPDQPWGPVAVAYDQPAAPGVGRVLLEGRLAGGDVDFGIDRYHVDAGLGPTLDQALGARRAAPVAEVRVDPQGHPALVGLVVKGERF